MLYVQSIAVMLFMLAFNLSYSYVNNAVVPELWISDLFYKALANFTLRNVGSTACQKQSEMYDMHLRNHTNWAVRMAESWNRHPIGILAGNKYHLGIYDECVDVYSPIVGQYCLSEIKIIPSEEIINLNYDKNENLHNLSSDAWTTILGWVDYPDQIQRNVLNLGICIPDACSALDLQETLQNEFDKVFLPQLVKAVVKVNPIMCTVKRDMYPYNTAYYVTSVFFVMLVLICLVATICQYIKLTRRPNKTEDHNVSLFYSFSFIETSKYFFKYNKDNEFNILNSFKTLTMVFVLFGHKYIYLAGSPMSNSKLAEQFYHNGPKIVLTGMNSVDPFFFMSGFLMYKTVTLKFQKSKYVCTKLASPIMHRILKMLPAYCTIMAITAHIMPHLGDGPFWSQKTWSEAEICKNYWWTNILFINNFIDAKYQCLIASWYVSCDIQLYTIGVFIVYAYTRMKNTNYRIGLLCTVISISLFLPFIVTILTNGEGILKLFFPDVENPRNSLAFNEMYRQSYMRATPFFIGLASGLIVLKLKEKNFKLQQKTVYGITFITVVICLWVQFYGAIFYNRQRPYYLLEHALYLTLSHCTWAVIAACIAICHFTTGYGVVSKLIINKFTVILGKLSFCVCLANLTIMMVSQYSQRLPSHLSIKSILDAWIYELFQSYLIAFMLHMTVEAPIGKIINNFF